jgi:hypothetical protein
MVVDFVMMEIWRGGAVGVYEAAGRVQQRAGSHASHARSNERTGAPSRSTPVPLPLSDAQQASQWRASAHL